MASDPYLVTRHTEDHTTRTGRHTTRRVVTEWHYPITEAEASVVIVTRYDGRNIRTATPHTAPDLFCPVVGCTDTLPCTVHP